MLKKSLLLLPIIAAMSTASIPAQAAEYRVVVPAPGKAAPYAAIKLELSPASLPVGWVGNSFVGFDFNTALRITGDPELDMSLVAWSVYSGSLPAGLSLSRGGGLNGTPTEIGELSFQALAKYKTKTAVGTYQIKVRHEKRIINNDGVRSWEDGAVAESCLEYRQPSYPYMYVGDTGDGIYRIAPSGSPIDVYCNMTSDGGGWTLLMKQAKGDGVTLQGDTTYWKNGTLLNDNQSSLNMGDGNLVSIAFSALPTTQFMLQASNEGTTKKHTNNSPMTGLAAFSDNRLAVYVDGPNTLRPNWSIHASSYPTGQPLASARFGFNFMESYQPSHKYICGARWGWAGNQDISGAEGSHDVCGGLGAWGSLYGAYGGKNAWQPATYYLWGK